MVGAHKNLIMYDKVQADRLYHINSFCRRIKLNGDVIVEFPHAAGCYFVKSCIAAEDHDGNTGVCAKGVTFKMTRKLCR